MRHVAARPIVHGLGPDVALGDGDVPHEIAERERARLVGPFQMLRRNARRDAARALAHARVVVQELLEIEHDGSV